MSVSNMIAEQYGGKRAWLRLRGTQMINLFGGYRNYRDTDVQAIKRYVFFCQGNICRSPFARYIAERHGISATSFGLSATTGSACPSAAISSASRLGVDLSSHKATSIHDFDFASGDLLIGFEPNHCATLPANILISKEYQKTLAGLWCRPVRPYIHDPYGSPADFFERTYIQIMECIENLPIDPSHRQPNYQ